MWNRFKENNDLRRIDVTNNALPTCVYETEALVTRTDELLDGLTRFLKLEKPLDPDYEVFSHTGRCANGGPGEKIKSGHLLSDRAAYDEIEIAPDVVAELEAHRMAALARPQEACDVTL